MERRRIALDISEIDIDDAKEAYINSKGVEADDFWEVLANDPHFFLVTDASRERYNLLGPNKAGRFLLVPIAPVVGSRWRLISAYWLDRRRGQRLYDQE
jgi:hypothetical protein